MDRPCLQGALIYLHSSSIEKTLAAVEAAGRTVLFPRTESGSYGFVAELQDSEGIGWGCLSRMARLRASSWIASCCVKPLFNQ
jgi:uncharacterized protein